VYWLRKYLFALSPAIIPVGGWQLAIWAYSYFGCQGNLKNLQPCFAGTVNILPFLGFGLFWCQLAIYVALPLSFWLIINVITKQYKALGNQN
jgi:hypothetical protein